MATFLVSSPSFRLKGTRLSPTFSVTLSDRVQFHREPSRVGGERDLGAVAVELLDLGDAEVEGGAVDGEAEGPEGRAEDAPKVAVAVREHGRRLKECGGWLSVHTRRKFPRRSSSSPVQRRAGFIDASSPPQSAEKVVAGAEVCSP